MKQGATAQNPRRPQKPRRTTLAVSLDFAEKLSDLAHGHGLSVADYCDRHLSGKVTANWKAMLRRKLESPGAEAKAGAPS